MSIQSKMTKRYDLASSWSIALGLLVMVVCGLGVGAPNAEAALEFRIANVTPSPVDPGQGGTFDILLDVTTAQTLGGYVVVLNSIPNVTFDSAIALTPNYLFSSTVNFQFNTPDTVFDFVLGGEAIGVGTFNLAQVSFTTAPTLPGGSYLISVDNPGSEVTDGAGNPQVFTSTGANLTATPEPSTWALTGISVLVVGGMIRRRRQQRQASPAKSSTPVASA